MHVNDASIIVVDGREQFVVKSVKQEWEREWEWDGKMWMNENNR